MADSNNLPCQKKIDQHFGTKAIHVGQSPDQWSFKDVVPPISLTTTYKQYGPNDHAVSFSFNLDKHSSSQTHRVTTQNKIAFSPQYL